MKDNCFDLKNNDVFKDAIIIKQEAVQPDCVESVSCPASKLADRTSLANACMQASVACNESVTLETALLSQTGAEPVQLDLKNELQEISGTQKIIACKTPVEEAISEADITYSINNHIDNDFIEIVEQAD